MAADRGIPEEIARAGIGRSFQITNLFPALSVAETSGCGTGADPAVRSADAGAFDRADQCRDRCGDPLLGLAGIETAEAAAVLWRPAPARHGWRSTAPRCCCWTSLAASRGERERIAPSQHSSDCRCCVEHDSTGYSSSPTGSRS